MRGRQALVIQKSLRALLQPLSVVPTKKNDISMKKPRHKGGTRRSRSNPIPHQHSRARSRSLGCRGRRYRKYMRRALTYLDTSLLAHVLNSSLTLIAVARFLGSTPLPPCRLRLSLDEPGLMPLRSFVSISNAAVASWSRSRSIGLPSNAG